MDKVSHKLQWWNTGQNIMFSSGRQKHDIKQLMLYIAIHTIYIRIDFLLITRTPLGVYLFQINKLYFNTRIYRIIFINVIGTIPNLIV